jgi:DNA repair exonuclease SbcCD ATPase subunit
MIKVKKIVLNGIRGVKSNCSIELDGKSILIYGESGTGKSSISDAFEWFHYDKINHLSGEEISRTGMLEALRNISLEYDKKSQVTIEFDNPSLNSDKAILFKKGSLVSEYSNKSTDFVNLLRDIQKENFILRHEDLTGFVLSPKGKKLEYLSDIIGFSEVTRIRAILKKTLNELKRIAKTKEYDNKINTQQAHLMEHLGENIVSESQFFGSINGLIEPLQIDTKIKNLEEIDSVLKLIKTPDNSKKIVLQSFYVRLMDLVSNMKNHIIEIKNLYKIYYDQ